MNLNFSRLERLAPIAIVTALAALVLTGCYTTREVMLRNPAHMRAKELLSPDPAATKMMTDPSQLPDMPAGYHDSTYSSLNPAETIVDPRRPIWRVTESNPNKIKTIFYDSNKQMNPSGYAWDGNSIQFMISRDYEFKTYKVNMEKVDSMLAVFTHYDGRKTRNAVLIGGSVSLFVIGLMIAYSN